MQQLYKQLGTITELIREHEYNGGKFFTAGAKRFFGSRIYMGRLWRHQTNTAIYFFVTSEKQPGANVPRTWSVRQYNRTKGTINTAGRFQAHASLSSAKAKALYLSTARAYVVGQDIAGDCPSCSGAANMHEPECINLARRF